MSGPHHNSNTYFNPSNTSAGSFQQRQQQQQQSYHQPQHHHQQQQQQHYGGGVYDAQQQHYSHHQAPLDYHQGQGGATSSYGMGMYQHMGAPQTGGSSSFGGMTSEPHMLPQHHGHPHSAAGYHHGGANEDVYGSHPSHAGMHHSMDSHHHQHQHHQSMAGSSSSAVHQQQAPNSPQDQSGNSIRPKRRQVKNACINCQKACKKCDEGRPCTRCIKYGLTETCIDSMRKERKRGIKRGPYKRRATTGSNNTAQNGSTSVGNNKAASYDTNAAVSSHSYDGSNGHSHGGASNSNSYDSSAYPMSAPTSYRALPSTTGAQNNNGGAAGYGGGFTSSPSLFPREQLRNNVWGTASSPIDAHTRLPQTAFYTGSNSHGALQQQQQQQQQQMEARSSSAPLGAQGSPVNATFPLSARPAGMTASSSSSFYTNGGAQHPLPSPSGGIGSMLASGGGRGGVLFSPPALPTTGSSNYLSATASARPGLPSMDGMSYGSSSSGSTANFSSPRTPLSAGGNGNGNGGVDATNMPHQLHDVSNNISAGPYIKSPTAYVHHPSATTSMAGLGGNVTAQPARPFPLQMPQFPRGRDTSGGSVINGLGMGMGMGAMKGQGQHQNHHVRTTSAGVPSSAVEA